MPTKHDTSSRLASNGSRGLWLLVAVYVPVLATAYLFWLRAQISDAHDEIALSRWSVYMSLLQAVVAALAFGGLLVTIHLQRIDNELTRKEMEAQVDQLEAQKNEMRRTAMLQLVSVLFQEYRRDQMTTAMAELRAYAKGVNWFGRRGDDTEIKNALGQAPGIRSQIVIVGHFFTVLAAVRARDLLDKNLLFGFWPPDTFDLIWNLLVPTCAVMSKDFGGPKPEVVENGWETLASEAKDETGEIPDPGQSGK